jgi:hypothetical protein
MIDNNKYATIIDSQGFKFTVYIFNGQDQPTPLNKNIIKSLVIEQSSDSWYIKGFIIIDDKYNILQRPYTSQIDPPAGMFYKFRSDGNDTLIIGIQPILDNSAPDTLKPEIWNLQLVLSIYDVQDFSFSNETGLKYKKLYFWEQDYQTMIERKIDWSTCRLVNNAANLTDKAKAVFTGDAIKDLITNALGSNQTFSADWDRGSSKINYTSWAGNNINDDLDYLIKSHVSASQGGTTGDFGILSRNRYTKEWNLESLMSIFGKAVVNNSPGPYQSEHFFISDSTVQLNNQLAVMPYKTPTSNTISLNSNIHLGQYSTIESYEFVDMAAIDNIKVLNTTPVYSNDLGSHQFNVEFEEHDISNIKDYIRTNYVNKLKHSIKPDVLLTLNKTKTEAIAIDPVYSHGITSTDRLASGKNTQLMSSLFLNQCVVFTVKGMTYRTSNRFIGIDRLFNDTTNDFDNRLLGQWYILNCKHIFIEDRYVNELTCVKIHSCATRNIEDNL